MDCSICDEYEHLFLLPARIKIIHTGWETRAPDPSSHVRTTDGLSVSVSMTFARLVGLWFPVAESKVTSHLPETHLCLNVGASYIV